ncbi:MAG: macB 13 [Acidobacteria bacterium]|nr:macB 13 [Acidobacteriota bacterium]
MEIGPIFRAMTRNRTKVALLVLEIAVTTAIVLNCLALILDQRARIGRDSGLDEANLISVTIRPWGADYADDAFRADLVRRDVAALEAVPGVAAAAAIRPTPLQGGGSSSQFKPLGAPDTAKVRSPVYTADPNVLATLGLELVEGRALEERDVPVESGPQILNCLVTRDFADALFPGESPIGKLIDSGSEEYPDVIVGVVARMVTPYGGGPMESRIVIYPGRPSAQNAMSYLVRAEPGERERVFGALDPALVATQSERQVTVRTLEEVKAGGYSLNVFLSKVLAILMVLLLGVTALGIFGTTSFSVTQRTKQIGTRRALGAARGEILRHFLVENSLIAAMGMALGLAGAFALNVLLVTQFEGGKLSPALTLAGVLLIWAIGVVATVAPARRASRLSPAIATRTI